MATSPQDEVALSAPPGKSWAELVKKNSKNFIAADIKKTVASYTPLREQTAKMVRIRIICEELKETSVLKAKEIITNFLLVPEDNIITIYRSRKAFIVSLKINSPIDKIPEKINEFVYKEKKFTLISSKWTNYKRPERNNSPNSDKIIINTPKPTHTVRITGYLGDPQVLAKFLNSLGECVNISALHEENISIGIVDAKFLSIKNPNTIKLRKYTINAGHTIQMKWFVNNKSYEEELYKHEMDGSIIKLEIKKDQSNKENQNLDKENQKSSEVPDTEKENSKKNPEKEAQISKDTPHQSNSNEYNHYPKEKETKNEELEKKKRRKKKRSSSRNNILINETTNNKNSNDLELNTSKTLQKEKSNPALVTTPRKKTKEKRKKLVKGSEVQRTLLRMWRRKNKPLVMIECMKNTPHLRRILIYETPNKIFRS